MDKDLKTGDVNAIIALLKGMPFKANTSPAGYQELEFAADFAEVAALRAECERARSAVRGTRSSDSILCAYQLREYGLGARSYRLSSNIYGYCVGDSLAANVGGGRFSCTPRGYSLEQAIAWGCNQAQKKNTSFGIGAEMLPPEVQAALGLTLPTSDRLQG